MDSASSLAYPGSRVVAGWWQQLQPYRPEAFWVGHLFVHRIEALTETTEPRPIDALSLHVLEALAIDQTDDGNHKHGPDPLPGRLHLPRPALHQLLIGLAGQDLVRRCEPGCWCLSERGRQVLHARADLAPRRERRTFPFVERLTPAGRRLGPPSFLPLAECPAQPWHVDDAHRFDAALLHEAVAQPAPWRERCGFPGGVQRVVTSVAEEPDSPWKPVVVDRSERVAVALAASGVDHAILGFAAHADGWKLLDATPVLRLTGDARDALPDLAVAPAAWQEAWRMWCRQRRLPLSEAEACRVSCDGIHLDVEAPESFAQRLRLAKIDIAREESGVFAGDGYLRAAALLRLHVRT